MLANGSAVFEGRTLLYDYVPWEQMSKQRRGLMWAMQLAHGLDRTLVLPPLRFHTSRANKYEFVPYSALFDLRPLAEIHPITELHQPEALARPGHADIVFSLLRGMPPNVLSAEMGSGIAHATNRYWVEGDCAKPIEAECEVDEQGEEECLTPLAHFAGAEGGLRVRNHTCGWSPDMRWDRILRARDVRFEPTVALQGIIYQIPPPPSVNALVSYREAAVAGRAACGWRCPYETMRAAMVYRRELVDAAKGFLAYARMRHTAIGIAQQRGEVSSGAVLDYSSGDGPELGSGSSITSAAADKVRVLAVHWRRGDFLARAGTEHTCFDEASGAQLYNGDTGARCVMASVVLTPQQLALEVRDSLRTHNATMVFLASNAKPPEVAALERELGGLPVIRYERPPPAPGSREPVAEHSAPELAVIDTLVCALADAFIGTRRSMFSWNILEERVLQDRAPATGRLMGLPRGTSTSPPKKA